jgi:hypothetical protein
MTYANQRKAKIAVKGATLWHDVLSIAREASAAPAATFKRANLPNAVPGGTSPVRTLSVTSFVFLLVSALNAMCRESGRKQCAKLHS